MPKYSPPGASWLKAGSGVDRSPRQLILSLRCHNCCRCYLAFIIICPCGWDPLTRDLSAPLSPLPQDTCTYTLGSGVVSLSVKRHLHGFSLKVQVKVGGRGENWFCPPATWLGRTLNLIYAIEMQTHKRKMWFTRGVYVAHFVVVFCVCSSPVSWQFMSLHKRLKIDGQALAGHLGGGRGAVLGSYRAGPGVLT